MDDRPTPPLSPEPASGPRDGDLPAYLGNGLIGLRIREVPLFAGMVLVSGLAGAPPERGIEAAAALGGGRDLRQPHRPLDRRPGGPGHSRRPL